MSKNKINIILINIFLNIFRSAFRAGAKRVSVVFRRGFHDLRTNDEEFEPAFFDGCNFIPYSVPKKVNYHADGVTVKSVVFNHHLPSSNDFKTPNYKTTNDTMVLPCDYLVTAFGSEIGEG